MTTTITFKKITKRTVRMDEAGVRDAILEAARKAFDQISINARVELHVDDEGHVTAMITDEVADAKEPAPTDPWALPEGLRWERDDSAGWSIWGCSRGSYVRVRLWLRGGEAFGSLLQRHDAEHLKDLIARRNKEDHAHDAKEPAPADPWGGSLILRPTPSTSRT